MSETILANNATKLAISTPKEVSFDAVVEKNATRSIKGVTRERLLLNANKLFATSCEEVRSMLGIEKGVRLPAEVASKLQDAVHAFVNKQIGRVNPTNAISFRRAFSHDFRQMRIVDRINVVGENVLALKEQHLGCNILITEKEKRLDDLMKKPNPDYDRELVVKEEIAKLKLTRTHIEACIAAATTETKKQ